MNTRGWLLGLSAVVVVSSLLGGCRTGPTAEEIVEHMQEVQASTMDAHAVVELDGQIEALEIAAVVELWEKRPNRFRAEVIEASETRLQGVVSVTDGQQLWLYHPGENEVLTGSVGELGMEEIGEPLYPQQLIELSREWIQWILDRYDVELAGEEELAGVATYRLELTPKQGEGAPAPIPVDGTITLWVEQDRWLVKRAHFDAGAVAEGWLRVRSFDMNAGVGDERFQFEVPAGAQIIRLEDLRPVPLTLGEARERADFPLLVPTFVPEDVTLLEVIAVGSTIVLSYDHSATAFTVAQRPQEEGETSGQPVFEQGPWDEAGAVRQEVTVRGQAASLVTDDSGNSLLSWVEGGVNITIAGRIGQEQILRVAESLQ